MSVERRPDYYHVTKNRTLIPHHSRRAQEVDIIGYPDQFEQPKNSERQPILDTTFDLDPPAEVNEIPNQTEL